MNDDLKNISNLLSGKTAIQAEIPTTTIIYLGITIFLAVLISVILANKISQ